MKMQTIHLSGKGGFLALLVEHLATTTFHGAITIGISNGAIVGARVTDCSGPEPAQTEVDLSDLDKMPGELRC